MAHRIVQATAVQLGQGETFEGTPLWSDRGGSLAVMHYPGIGSAYIWGPMRIGNPNKPFFEVQCENAAVEAEVLSRADSVQNMNAAARSNGLIRAFIATTNRPRIKNTNGDIVGYMPAHVICGTSPIDSFLDGEDVDEAPLMPDLPDVAQ